MFYDTTILGLFGTTVATSRVGSVAEGRVSGSPRTVAGKTGSRTILRQHFITTDYTPIPNIHSNTNPDLNLNLDPDHKPIPNPFHENLVEI